MNRRHIISVLQTPSNMALRSSRRGEGQGAPPAPSFRAKAPHPVARGGVRRGLTTPANCVTHISNMRPKSRPPFMRLIPIAALIIGLLQSGAAFSVLLTAPAGGVGLPRRGERAQAIRDVKLDGASTFPLARAGRAGPDGLSMPVLAKHGDVLHVAGNLSARGASV